MPFDCITVLNQDSEFAKMNIVNVVNYGARGDGTTDDLTAIQNAVNASANKDLYFPPGTYLIDGNLTIGSDVKVIMANGAKIKPTFGKVLTINGKLSAGLHQIFDDFSGVYNRSTSTDDGLFNGVGGWTVGTGWTIAGGVATHTIGNTGTLSYANCAGVSGVTYIIKYTVGGTPNGGIIPSIGGVSGYRRTSAGTYIELITATGTGALTFTPETNFGGTLDNVEVYRIGTHVFGSGSVKEIIPQWFGAKGDDSTDNSIAINEALASIANIGTITFPAGTYRLTSPITRFPTSYNGYPTTGLRFQGSGMSYTIFKYMGSDDGFAIMPCRDSCMALPGSVVSGAVNYITFCDFQVQAPNANSSGGGFRVSGSRNKLERISFRNIPNGAGLKVSRSRLKLYDTGHANDTNIELTSTGSGATEKIAIKFTQSVSTVLVKSIKVRMRKLGNPTGTMTASIYTNSSGVPGTIVGSASNNTVNCSSLSTNSDGAEVEFTWTMTDSGFVFPELESGTTYWLVISTTGYTNDASNKVYIRAKSNDTSGGFATYNYGTSSWTASNYGSDLELNVAFGQPILPVFDSLQLGKTSSSNIKTSVIMEDDSQGIFSNCVMQSNICVVIRGDVLAYFNKTDISPEGGEEIGISSIGNENTKVYISDCYLEGGGYEGNGYYFDGGWYTLTNSTAGIFPSWTTGTRLIYDRTVRAQYPVTDDPTMRLGETEYIVLPESVGIALTNGMTIASDTDGDALGTKRLVATSNQAQATVWFDHGSTNRIKQWLPRGTYLFTAYAKDTNQVTNDFEMATGIEGNVPVSQSYTLTNHYRPYHLIVDINSSCMVNAGRILMARKDTTGTNTIYISHFEIRKIAVDKIGRSELVAYNANASDGDGRRESSLWFIGRRTPADSNDTGVVSALAQIRAVHDGTSRDEKGKLELLVNDGDDRFRPSKTISFDSSGVLIADGLYLAGRSVVTSNIYRFAESILRQLTSPKLLIGWTSSNMSSESDLSGNSNNGTYYGSPSANINKHLVYVFNPDGSNDRLEIADADSLSFGNGTTDSPVSIGMWLEVVDLSATKQLLSKFDQTSDSELREWYVNIDSSEKISIRFYDESVDAYRGRIMSSGLSVGWHFVVITYDGSGLSSGITMYVDGSSVSSTSTDGGSYVAMENLTANVQVACNKTGSSTYGNFYSGDIGPVFIDGSVLTSKKIWELYLLGRSYLGI